MTDAAIGRRHSQRDALLAKARDWAARAGPMLDARAIVVVGSVARGDFNKWSDLDLLVVADGLPAGLGDRLVLLGPTEKPPGVEAIVWTPAELRQRTRRATDPIAREAFTAGAVVYGSLP